jgi:hypothetical protein
LAKAGDSATLRLSSPKLRSKAIWRFVPWRAEGATKFLGQRQSSCQVSEEAKIAKDARLPKKTKGSS